MKTLYISDLDGTLLDHNAEVSKNTAAVLNRLIAEGMLFSIATARSPATALKILSEVDLRFPLILMSGALVYDPTDRRYIKVEQIDKQATAEIIHILKSHNINGFMYGLKK